MTHFLKYFIALFLLVLIASIFHAHFYALLIVVALATIKLIREIVAVDLTKLKYAFVVIATYVTIAILYGGMYFLLGIQEQHIKPNFQRSFEGLFDAIYFSFVTITTLGYGDFEPTSFATKGLVISQLIVGIIIIAVGINYVISKDRI